MLKMMTKGKASHAEMIDARQSEGINVIFEQDTLPSPSFARSRSRSSSSSSRSSGSDRRAAGSYRRHNRSSSTSSSSSRSSSRSRSRSHPRCHRGSSCCRCHRNGYGRRHRSPPRRYRARSRSYSRSPSQNRSLHHRSYRSRSRSAIRWSTSRRGAGPSRCSRSPYRTYRSHSRSRSSGRSAVSLCLDEKRELLRAARANAIKLLGVEHLELPESVKPLLGEQPAETKQATPEARVRPEPVSQKTPSQSSKEETDVSSPKMSPNRKLISFSIHNSVAKPTVAPSCAKVTPRMDSYESRKPYGQWVPVKKHQTSRKRTLTISR